MKRILTRSQYLENLNSRNYNKYTKINEAFANDVNWGDSWVGILISSIGRKIKTKRNLKKMDGVIDATKKYFDSLVDQCKINVSEQLSTWVMTSSLMGNLEDGINNEEDVESLIRICETIIELIENTSPRFEDEDFMIDKIEEFMIYLESLISKEGDKEGEGDEEGEGEGEGDSTNPNEVFYKTSKEFLQSIVDLHNMIKSNVVRFGGGKEPGEDISTSFNKDKYDNIQKSLVGNKNPVAFSKILVNSMKMEQEAIKISQKKGDNKNVEIYTKKLNDNLKKLINIQANSYGISKEKKDKSGKSIGYKNIEDLKKEIETISKQKWSVDLPLGKSSGAKSTGDKEISGDVKIDKSSYSFLYEEAEANLQKDEVHAKNAWKKVINAYEKSGIKNFIPQIEELLKTSSKDGKDKLLQSKKDIKSICKQVVLNKSTTGNPISFEELIKETVNVNDVAKSISLFGRILLSFKEDMGLTGSYGSAISPLKKFVNSFFELEKLVPKLKKESVVITSYNNFLILEKTEGLEYSKIEEKFNEIFDENTKKIFQIDAADGETIKKSGRISEEFIISNENQIFELVRLFLRAWRLHTPGRIPSGRTGGKVAGRVFDQYEYVGSSTEGTPDAPGVGPYRNKEIYEKWENAILDILGETKYTETIFSDDAKFYFKIDESEEGKGKLSEMGSKLGETPDKDNRNAKPVGKILLKFIRQLIDDPKIYRQGAIGTFLNEYFNISDNVSGKAIGKGGDLQKAEETAAVVKDKVEGKFVELSEAKVDSISKKLSDNPKNKFYLRISAKVDGGNPTTLYLIYLGKKDNDYYFFISDGNKVTDTTSLIDLETTTTLSKSLRLVKMDYNIVKDLGSRGNLKPKTSKINFITGKTDDNKTDDFEFEEKTLFIQELKILVNKESKEILDKVWYDKKDYYDKLEKFGLNDFKFKK